MSEPEFEDDEDAFSLEELGAAYKHLVSRSDSEQWPSSLHTGEVLQREQLIAAQSLDGAVDQEDESQSSEAADDQAGSSDIAAEDVEVAATPEAIIEAALFVGNPNGNGITAARLASIMRDMTPEEVVEMIESLNAAYRSNRQGIRIANDESGYRLVIAPEVESIRHVFTGKVRETRLNQASVEVLALVAYQPGITAAECSDKRGRESGPLLNQMVRRRLIEMKREPEDEPGPDGKVGPQDAKPAKTKLVSRFYPAERLLVLLGLESLEDLPQVEEVHLE